jgi:D-alanyl-lipoteichoic acid acyltransferase DltB (MBOAT superfamily)
MEILLSRLDSEFRQNENFKNLNLSEVILEFWRFWGFLFILN